MDIFNVLIMYVYFLFGVFTLQAIVSAVLTAVHQVTGQTVTEHLQFIITWAPMWSWRLLDNLFPAKQEKVVYFKF